MEIRESKGFWEKEQAVDDKYLSAFVPVAVFLKGHRKIGDSAES